MAYSVCICIYIFSAANIHISIQILNRLFILLSQFVFAFGSQNNYSPNLNNRNPEQAVSKNE